MRSRVNDIRVDSPDAFTLIQNALSSSTVLSDLINWLVSWFLILVPLPLLLLLELQYVVAFILVTLSVYAMFSGWRSFQNDKSGLSSKEERQVRAAFLFMLAFTLVQGIFEPDYGSVIKHMIDLLPTLAFVVAQGYYSLGVRERSVAN